MKHPRTGSEKTSLSADDAAEGTYPVQIRVLRYALERNARAKPDDIFAAFEGGECWTFARKPCSRLKASPAISTNLASVKVTTLSWCCRHLRWHCGQCSPSTISVSAHVPVNPALKGSSLEHVLHNAGAAFAIVNDGALDPRPCRSTPSPHHDRSLVRRPGMPAPPGPITIYSVSALTKTAASPPTPPRPISAIRSAIDHLHLWHDRPVEGRTVILHAQLFLRWARRLEAACQGDDRQLLHMPIFHIGGAFIACVSLCVGVRSRWKPFSHRSVLGSDTGAGSHSAFLLGAMATFLLKQPPHPRDRDHRLRMVFIVPLGQSGPAFCERFGVDVFTLFNMTEICTPLISHANPSKDSISGRPRAGVEVRLVDENDCKRAGSAKSAN